MKEECCVRKYAVDLLTDREDLIGRFCDSAVIVPLEKHHLWVQLDDDGPWSFVEFRGSRALWSRISGGLCGNAGSAVIRLTVGEDEALQEVSELLQEVVCGFPADCEWTFGVSIDGEKTAELQMELLLSDVNRERRKKAEREKQEAEWDRFWNTVVEPGSRPGGGGG